MEAASVEAASAEIVEVEAVSVETAEVDSVETVEADPELTVLISIACMVLSVQSSTTLNLHNWT